MDIFKRDSRLEKGRGPVPPLLYHRTLNYQPIVGLMLVRRSRRRPNIKPTLGVCCAPVSHVYFARPPPDSATKTTCHTLIYPVYNRRRSLPH